MKKELNTNNGNISLTINKEKRIAVIHIAFNEGEISYDLTPEQAEQFGLGLLKIYGYFSGKGDIMTIYSERK